MVWLRISNRPELSHKAVGENGKNLERAGRKPKSHEFKEGVARSKLTEQG
jgi:hypothetical protein